MFLNVHLLSIDPGNLLIISRLHKTCDPWHAKSIETSGKTIEADYSIILFFLTFCIKIELIWKFSLFIFSTYFLRIRTGHNFKIGSYRSAYYKIELAFLSNYTTRAIGHQCQKKWFIAKFFSSKNPTVFRSSGSIIIFPTGLDGFLNPERFQGVWTVNKIFFEVLRIKTQ